MTEKEQLMQMRIVLLNDKDDDTKDDYFKMTLNDSKAIILNTLYPFDKEVNDISSNNFRLRNWQVRCAIELYGAMQHDGVQSYMENGFSVTYLTSKISSSLYNELVPKAGCPISRGVRE